MLEQTIVLLLLVVEVVHYRLVKHLLLHKHQRFDVLETHVVLQSTSQEEKILDDARTLVLLTSEMVIGFEDGIGKRFIFNSVVANDGIVFEHGKLVSHELQVGVHFVEVTLATDEQILEAADEVAALLEHCS